MQKPPLKSSLRRQFLRSSLIGLGALSTASVPMRSVYAASGRTTNTVRLCWSVGAIPSFAKARGNFEKLLAKDGIKVEWLGPFVGHAPALQAVVGGSADLTFGGSSAVALSVLAGGAPLVFFLFVDTKPRTTAIITREESGITRIEDLVGKTVAVNRSGLGEFLLVAALEKHHIDRSKVNVIFLNPPDAGPAFAAGKIDAWSTWGITTEIARTKNKTRDLFIESRDLDYQVDFPCMLTTERFARENPDLLRAVSTAFTAEAQWTNQNRRQAEDILQKEVNYSDAIRDIFIAQNRRVEIHNVNEAAFIASVQKSADWLVSHRIVTEKLVVAEHLARF